MMRLRYGDNFCRPHASDSLWRKLKLGDVTANSTPPAMYWARRRSRSPAGARASSPPATTGRIRPPCTRFEWCPATSSSRGHFWSAGMLSPRRCGDEVKKLLASWRCFRSGASGRRLFARQGPARDRAVARGRLRRAGLSAWCDGKDHALLQSRGVALGDLRPVKGMRKPISPAPSRWRRPRPPPTSGPDDSPTRWTAFARLDAVAPPPPAARHRTAAGDFGPRGWDGLTATIDATGRAKSGSPMARRTAGALVHGKASPRAARSRRLW